LENHYNYVFDNITITYNFTTKNNILYRVAFIIDETFSTISGKQIDNVFQLIIDKANQEVEPYDSKVSKTIGNIIDNFFKNKENCLIYICSEESDEAKLRQQVFDRWYKKSSYKNVIVKIDNIIKINTGNGEIHNLYTSFLFHQENANYEILIEIYNQIEKTLNEK
jgi:hypothetical protein